MKICFIMCHTGEEFGINSDDQYSKHYGYEQSYCKAMLDQGWDVTLIVLSHRPGIAKFRHIYGHTIIRVSVSLSFGVSRQLSNDLFCVLKNELNDVDIFHINSIYALLCEPLVLFLKLHKKKIVMQSHSAQYSLRNPIHFVRLCLLFFSLRLPNKVLTVNPLEYRLFKEKYSLSTVLAFPNGVDTTIFRPLKIERKQNSLLFVGRLWPEKGLSVLFTAYESLVKKNPNLSLTLVGRGPLEDLVFKMQKKYGDRIRYIPFIKDKSDLVSLYNSHDLLVLPSLREPFGIVVLESLACGTPVITASNCGAALFLKPYSCVETVAPRNSSDLASKIEALLNDRTRLSEISQKGITVVSQYFTWTILGKKLESVYLDI